MLTLKRGLLLLVLVLVSACVGVERGCSSCMARNMGSDWIVVQYRLDGSPLNCWRLENAWVANEAASDGIFWRSPEGHLVHLAGHYNCVQVTRGDFVEAAKELGIDPALCPGGRYLTPGAGKKSVEAPGQGEAPEQGEASGEDGS